ncbi:MAG: single-stranded DNA-binding protein [Planctomycetes bacterium]|nr:single-stranded DNA-binding protein [Planctomycetota bacterium]
MASVNKVMLLGRLTRDPELRYTGKGTAVCDLGLALNRVGKDANGEKKEEVTFVDVTAWERTAELCAQYLKKGRQVFIEGRLKFEQWDAKDGTKRSKLSVTADQVTFVDGGGGGAREPGDGEGAESGGGAKRGGFQRGAPSGGPRPPSRPQPSQEPAHDDQSSMDEQPPKDMEGDPPF